MNHIKVKNREQDERYVMLTLVDGDRLTLSTLESVFPGSSALYYKENDLRCAVGRRQNGYGLNEPFFEGGNGWWAQHVFFTSKDASPPGAPAIRDVQAISKRMGEARKFLYFDLFQSGARKNCVVAIAPKLAVTFKHGTHQNMRVGQMLHIYNQDCVAITVLCAHVSDYSDYIIYHRQDGGSFAAPKIDNKPTVGMPYLLLGFPFEGEVLHCVQGAVSSVEYWKTNSPTRFLGQGDVLRGFSGEAAFSLETGALFAINVISPSFGILDDYFKTLAAEIDSAEETTHRLMPMTAIIVPQFLYTVQKAVEEWSSEKLPEKTATLKCFLMDQCKIKEEEAGGLANKLIEKGIIKENIEKEITKIIGQRVARYEWSDHMDKILEGLYSLTAEFKVDVSSKEAEEHEPEGSGTSEKPPSHSTQPDVVHSSMDCYFTVIENMDPEQENVEMVTAGQDSS